MPIADNLKTVAEITLKGSCAAGGSTVKPVANVYHFKRTTVVNPWSLANIEAAFMTAVGNLATAALNVDYTETACVVRSVDDATDLGLSTVETNPGLVAGDRLQLSDTVMVLLRSSTRGASYRGRKHFSPISETHTTEEIMSAAGIAAWDGVAAAILGGFTDANGNVWLPYVLSKTLSQLGTNPTNVVGDVITSVLARRTIGTLRRRRPAPVY